MYVYKAQSTMGLHLAEIFKSFQKEVKKSNQIDFLRVVFDKWILYENKFIL